MKTSLITSAVALVALTIALACQSCTVVETTAPDGTKVRTTTVDPATAQALANAALAASQRDGGK